nr:MAG TPA: hypothetical protein [Caudoviricetes sp.]
MVCFSIFTLLILILRENFHIKEISKFFSYYF